MTTNEILEKLKGGVMESPDLLSQYLVQLSATTFTSLEFETDAEVLANRKWLELKTVLLPDGKAKSDKQIDKEFTQTEEWRTWQKMHNANKSILQTIQALKKRLRSLEEEANLAR